MKSAQQMPSPELDTSQSDRIYRRIIEAHRGLDDEQSKALDARLVLSLALELGDVDRIEKAIDRAAKAG